MAAITRWFIDNPIASKLLMLVIILAGLLSYPVIPKIFFPEPKQDFIQVSVTYPGAGPAEVEAQVTRRIEEAIEQLSGMEEVRSVSREGYSEVNIEVATNESSQRLLNDVRANVDAITTFPSSAEQPQVIERRHKTTIMRLQLAGDVSERELKELGEQLREELAALPDTDIVELVSTRNYEVSIEVSEQRLAEFGIDFNQVATAVRQYSFDLPVGKIRDSGGDIQLQARVQADSPADFAEIPVVRKQDGSIIQIGDIAQVIDGFADVDLYSQLNGKNAVELQIINQTSPDILKTSDSVSAYVQAKQSELPDLIEFKVLSDMSVSYRGRLDTLIKNGSGGLVLVFILLMFFLRPSLALWVCGGIAVAFLGAMWGMSFTPVTLNVLSMFSFIMILGIVVDDAIVIGESIHTQQEKAGNNRLGAIIGVKLMLTPVAFAVISTIIFFIPFYFLTEQIDTSNIATPVILALLFSLVESFFLLPSHLAHQHYSTLPAKSSLQTGSTFIFAFKKLLAPIKSLFREGQLRFERIRKPVADWMPRFANTVYRGWLVRSIAGKWLTLLLFFIAFGCSISVLRGGWLGFSFFPRVTADFVLTSATLPESSSYNETFELMQRIERAGEKVRQNVNEKYEEVVISDVYANATSNRVFVMLVLASDSDRPISAQQIARHWRSAIGGVYGVTDISVQFTLFDIPKALGFDVKGSQQKELAEFTAELLAYLKQRDGVFDAQSTLEHPSSEINFALNPGANALDISLQDVARQIRQAFYGEEVQRIPREREDVKVFARYPREHRSYEEALLDMKILSPQGERIPLNTVVDTSYQTTYKKFEHLDGLRVAAVSADVHSGFSAPQLAAETLRYVERELLPKYPGIKVSMTGEEKDKNEFLVNIRLYFSVAILAIYALMAIIFRSYWQPLLILSAIPFGFMGGVYGHVLLGINLSMFSVLGMLACAGVVVNDNVVLIDQINHLRGEGLTPRVAIVRAAVSRFRPIVLTSLTTFLGLTPILLETSVQAQFLIPMVISLSFGVLCATTVTLLFVPCLYLVGDNFMRKAGFERSLVKENGLVPE